jgi:peptidoglycan/LPS O-acetylase OafA/YrhL
MIYSLSLQKGRLRTFLSHQIFVWAGEISYAIFILQKPVFLFGRKYLPKMGLNNPDAQFYLLVAVLTLLSSLVYIYFENPIRKKIVQLAAK